MAGFIGLSVADVYISDYRATEEVENGMFVELNHTDKTGSLAGADATEVYFVENEITGLALTDVNDMDFKVKEGQFLRAHRPIQGEVLVTTCIDGDLVVGDYAKVVGDGKVGAASEGEGDFVVDKVTNELGAKTVHLIVL